MPTRTRERRGQQDIRPRPGTSRRRTHSPASSSAIRHFGRKQQRDFDKSSYAVPSVWKHMAIADAELLLQSDPGPTSHKAISPRRNRSWTNKPQGHQPHAHANSGPTSLKATSPRQNRDSGPTSLTATSPMQESILGQQASRPPAPCKNQFRANMLYSHQPIYGK